MEKYRYLQFDNISHHQLIKFMIYSTIINSLMELDVALELRNVFKSFGDGHENVERRDGEMERWRVDGGQVDKLTS